MWSVPRRARGAPWSDFPAGGKCVPAICVSRKFKKRCVNIGLWHSAVKPRQRPFRAFNLELRGTSLHGIPNQATSFFPSILAALLCSLVENRWRCLRLAPSVGENLRLPRKGWKFSAVKAFLEPRREESHGMVRRGKLLVTLATVLAIAASL